ncbi:MAG TPA: hypothetical protein VJP77_08400, partial [Planctomycetota bacterium]|nr:hypothetical protein [Planctomycetota bacterium]
GAEVPFFLAPGPALVGGIGEQIEPAPALPRLALVLAHPGDSLATAQVYATWDTLEPALTPRQPGSTLRALSDLLACDPSDRRARAARLGALIVNDLEAAAVRLCPPIRRLARAIAGTGALATAMSGSGAAVYGIFASGEEAAAAIERVREAAGARGWVRLAVTGGSG